MQSLFVETDKNPGEVLGKAVSRSGGNLFEVELLEKDQMDENNGGIHPWSVEGDYESHLLLFNHSKMPQVFGVGISSGTTFWDKKYTLAPNETREISINALIQDKVPDEKGRILGPESQRGVVNWMVPDSGNATGRLMITSRSGGMARNFSCGTFIVDCGVYFETYDNGLIPVNSTGDLWAALPTFCSAWGPGQCSGGNPVSSGSATYYWTIGATSIIKATSSAQVTVQSPQVTGVSAGTGSGYVEAEGGSCQCGGSGPGSVQVPTASRIVTTATEAVPTATNAAATDCGAGLAGWNRIVGKIVTDQETPPQDIVQGGQSLTENYTVVTPNVFGFSTVGIGHGATYADGSFGDRFEICSNICPKSAGTMTGSQVISDLWDAQTYNLTANTIVWSCSAITVNGK